MEEKSDKTGMARGRPRELTIEARRQQIIAAAFDAFVELGFAKTTTAVVAAKAKVSKRTIYEVFADKITLFAAVVAECQPLILDLPRPEGESLEPLDSLVAIFRLNISDDEERVREAVLNLIARESVQFPELSDYLYENKIIRSREALIDWLHSTPAFGELSTDDAKTYAGMLMDIVFGALLPRRRLKGTSHRQTRNESIKQRLAIFLRGVL